MRFLLILALLGAFSSTIAQNNGFSYGQITPREIQMLSYEKDTTAVAVVLNEFGEAYIDTESFDLVFEHHIKIKILKNGGLSQGDFSIPLYKSSKGQVEKLKSVQAIVYNYDNDKLSESRFDESKIFTENLNKYWDLKKFALPNVRVGSVIEVRYVLESPFIFNFRKWEFQSTIPKIVSEYWAKIPGNYLYNISLKGFQNLSKNESSLIDNCIASGSGYSGGAGADCALYKFAMKNIPAFLEEDYMTASSNFVSSINFELSEVRYFDGRVDKVTKEWKDAEMELLRDSRFGTQLKRGKDIGKKIEEIISGISDPAEKAQKIYTFIKTWYTWNDTYGYYSDLGIKKAFETKTGNIGDINLSLIAALEYGGLAVEPVLLSTRDNGSVTELHPVLSDFNYVVAKVNLGDKVFLLDASDPYLPFGLLPERCLNGKGRVFADKKPSYWYDLKPTEKYRSVIVLDLNMEPTGVFKGTIQQHHYGYRALEKRKKITSFNNQEEYLEELKKDLREITINNYEAGGVEDFNGPITEKFEVEMEGFDNLNNANFLLNPFFIGKIDNNPFRSNERLFPVDFGAPLETTIVFNLTYPSSIELDNAPERAALTLPNSGGKFVFDVISMENKLTFNYLFSINKTVFNSTEYSYLKELYSRVIQTQQTDFLFKKKK